MSPFTQKYTIIHFLRPLSDGYEFASSDWPLHITLAETFSIQNDASVMIDSMSDTARRYQPIPVIAGKDAHFGPDHTTPVVLITMPPELVSLHNTIVASLEKDCKATFNNPHYIKQGYAAHSTIRPESRLSKGDHVTIDSISVVDMFPDKNPYKRKVLATFSLGN